MSKKTRSESWDYDCAVIGGGPGGLVAAVYLGRFRRKTVLINAGRPRASWIPRTHNLLGYDRGISGGLLLRRLHRQVSACAVDRVRGEAKVSRVRGGFEVEVGARLIRARKVLLATGIEDEHPRIPNLSDLREQGLLRYCSICDGYEYRDCPIAVLAKDSAGIDKAIFLSRWTRNIRVIVPSDFRIPPTKAAELRKVSWRKVIPCDTLSLEPTKGRPGLWLKPDRQPAVYVRVAYVELGFQVKDAAFRHLTGLKRTKEGYVITSTEQRTSVPGIYAIGDCVGLLGQISVAAGQAAVAATAIHNDLGSG